MRKLFLIAFVTLFSFTFTNAQDASYGLTAGYNNLIARAKLGGVSSSAGESGLFVGVFADFPVSEKFHIQPEVQYAVIFADGGSGDELVIPIMAKYYVADKFNLQAGPQFDIILDESPGIKTLGIGLGAGAGYDFSDQLFVSMRYSFGLNNRIDDELTAFDFEGTPISLGDITSKFNVFQIGLGYRF